MLSCPWHGWQYDVRTGENEFDRAIVLETYDGRVEDGDRSRGSREPPRLPASTTPPPEPGESSRSPRRLAAHRGDLVWDGARLSHGRSRLRLHSMRRSQSRDRPGRGAVPARQLLGVSTRELPDIDRLVLRGALTGSPRERVARLVARWEARGPTGPTPRACGVARAAAAREAPRARPRRGRGPYASHEQRLEASTAAWTSRRSSSRWTRPRARSRRARSTCRSRGCDENPSDEGRGLHDLLPAARGRPRGAVRLRPRASGCASRGSRSTSSGRAPTATTG